jgi:DNA topoisomerase VI subunit B
MPEVSLQTGTENALTRVVVSRSRAGEYFESGTLQTMTGQPRARFADVVIKELADNALDAAELRARRKGSRPPRLRISVSYAPDAVRLTVADNGAGITPDLLRRALDLERLTSDKAVYRTPTRGAQGNALKTVIGIPHALGSTDPVTFDARHLRHTAACRIDPAGLVHLDLAEEATAHARGTRVALTLPAAACGVFRPGRWARGYSLFNPHAEVIFQKTGRRGRQC